MYSQNKEDEIIADYFGDFKGTLLDAGANDGVTFSNSHLLLNKGWLGHLFEPSSVFYDLEKLYSSNGLVSVYHKGIGAEAQEEALLEESGSHLPDKKDRALLSTFVESEKSRWKGSGVRFNWHPCSITGFKAWYYYTGKPTLDFISIDIEGMDWELLQAIDLTAVGCKCLCIEWNSNKQVGEQFKSYCIVKHGMKLLHTNAENKIFVR